MKKIYGQLYGYSTHKISTEVQVTPAGLQLVSPELSRSLSYAELTIRAAGTNDDAYVVSTPELGNASLVIEDERFLRALARVPTASIQAQLRTIKKKNSTFYQLIAAALVLIVSIGVGLLLMRDYLLKRAITHLPPSVDQMLAKAAEMRVNASTHHTDPATIRYFEHLITPIFPTSDQSPFKYQVHISKSKDKNAFAYPGGYIEITEGLILEADSSEEILGVLAHEIAHIEKRHSMHALAYQMGIGLSSALIFGDTSAYQILAQADRITSIHNTKDMEREADQGAVDLMAKHQISPAGIIRFFEKASEKLPKGSTQAMVILDFLSTHPSYPERLELFRAAQSKQNEAQSNELSKPLPSSKTFDLLTFKEMLQKN